jgi:hypothetical protein
VASLRIRIKPNGEIEAETVGIKGEACLEYIRILEELLEAETVRSSFTDEYRQTVEVPTEQRLASEE